MDVVSRSRARRGVIFSDFGILALLGLAVFLLHMLTNGQYGFHRDELETLDDARFPAWGYVEYPPFAPSVARLALALFGPSLVALRLFAALAQSIAIVLAGLITVGPGRHGTGRRYRARLADPGSAVSVHVIRLPVVGFNRFSHHPAAGNRGPSLVAWNRCRRRSGDDD